MSSSHPPEDERRASPRQFVALAGQVEAGDNEYAVMLRNISRTGALLLSRKPLEVGENFNLCILLSSDGSAELSAECEVVRVEDLEMAQRSWWRRKVAVTFAEPLDSHQDVIDELARSAQENYG